MAIVKKQKEKEKGKGKGKFAAIVSLCMLAVLVSSAGASYTFTGNLSDLGMVITDFLTLSDELIGLVIFGVTITCAGAIGGFMTGFFGMLISNMRIGR